MAQHGRKSTIYGEATVREEGRGVPMTIQSGVVGLADKAGMEPSRLDIAIENLVRNVEDSAEVLLQNGPMLKRSLGLLYRMVNEEVERLETLLAAPESGEVASPILSQKLVSALELTGKISIIMDRTAKSITNAVKAQDDAIRLRTFIATGDEGESGLENLGENQLRRIVNAAAGGFVEKPIVEIDG